MNWDKGVDYEFIYKKLLKLLKSKKELDRCYASILLIQLTNGARISEAVRAYKEFVRTGRNEVFVRVSKKKRDDMRLMVIHPHVEKCVDLADVDEELLKERVRKYCISRLGVNTHSLRYAFITHLLKLNISPSIIAKITHHSKLDFILHYTQKKTAEEVLKEVIEY